MGSIHLAELHRHIPAVDERGDPRGCSCGWQLKEQTEDLWWSWVQHLQPPAPNLDLSAADREWLRRALIKE